MSKYIMVDLFAGLGGASQAMVEHDGWLVIRIDNAEMLKELVPDLILKDVMDDDIIKYIEQRIKNRVEEWNGVIDIIWASPPCEQFSAGYNSILSACRRSGEIFVPDLALFIRTLEIIDALKPTTWIIENVGGSREYLRPILGANRLKIGPFYLWGNMPGFYADVTGHKKMGRHEDRYGRRFRSNARAKIPFALSEALRQSVTYQTALDNFHQFKASM